MNKHEIINIKLNGQMYGIPIKHISDRAEDTISFDTVVSLEILKTLNDIKSLLESKKGS